MAYNFHIERKCEPPIALREWRAAVEATKSVQLCAAADHLITNPITNVEIDISASEGDAEVFFSDEGKWHCVFLWCDESAAFAARFDPTATSHPTWKAAVALATRLGAVIRGDEGEEYDLITGEVVDD